MNRIHFKDKIVNKFVTVTVEQDNEPNIKFTFDKRFKGQKDLVETLSKIMCCNDLKLIVERSEHA